ncbi:unnamed protein product [Rotaria sp. Silwood2]|nr:unnamed protein product [Rotaria sp. Silwood2]CAF2937328.1 unnamed protein product [Rotaria sp. Silwood2]CAF3325408.1 unnamed protein product [Rotaria sp. Silwood2]CAF4283145.1 unnamed protein product [Rotaria sp. Silwood2]CAF4323992.1 unnamed protein product [Rotaria sp. Silwood2]
MATILEHLSVEILYEIFIYFRYHEVFNIFSNLNSRFAAVINNISFIPVYLGLNGMSIVETEFYYRHLSEPNISNHLISLCVSDTLSIDNGLWLASHVSTFINLHHLSLVDIKRSSFELILNSLTPIDSLVMFSIQFSTNYRAAYTFIGVPEGAYYEQIFHLYPSLRVCHLFFWRYTHYTPESQFVLPPNRTFMRIQTSLLKLQSLALECSPSFLSYLFEHLPQLEQLSYTRCDPWLPDNHPLIYDNNNRITLINKRLAPNLRRLKIKWFGPVIDLESVNKLFERDVLFSLTSFTFLARIDGPHVLHNLLSMLSSQCLYSLDVKWFVETIISLSETGKILCNIFQQLKGSMPIELELSLEENMYSIRAVTLPKMDKSLYVYFYLHKNSVHGQSRWPYNRRAFNSQLLRCNEILMSNYYDQINDEFLSLSPPIVPWYQVTLLRIVQPFSSSHLYFLFSQTINLRTLELHYSSEYEYAINLKKESLVYLLDDASLCNILMSNGLRELNIFTAETEKQPNLINIAHLIVERLPHLQVIKVDGISDRLIEMSHILINSLSKLNFLTICGGIKYDKVYDKRLRDLQNSNTRSFRTEVPNTINEDTLLVWL